MFHKIDSSVELHWLRLAAELQRLADMLPQGTAKAATERRIAQLKAGAALERSMRQHGSANMISFRPTPSVDQPELPSA